MNPNDLVVPFNDLFARFMNSTPFMMNFDNAAVACLGGMRKGKKKSKKGKSKSPKGGKGKKGGKKNKNKKKTTKNKKNKKNGKKPGPSCPFLEDVVSRADCKFSYCLNI